VAQAETSSITRAYAESRGPRMALARR
jgi:hypothetical protein